MSAIGEPTVPRARPSRRLLAIALIGAAAGCRGPSAASRPTDRTLDEGDRPVLVAQGWHADPPSLPPEEQAWLEDNCRGGEPRVDEALGPTRLIVREGYALRHSRADRIPIFVCEHVEADELGAGPRPSGWRRDPKLDEAEGAEDADYKGSGYSRGHMAPNADFADPDRKKETFFLSNAVPQDQQNNSGIWASLEGEVRDRAKAHPGGAWVFTGPMFWDPDEEDGAKADGRIPSRRIGEGRVAVPTHLFKIVLVEVDGQLEVVAWVVANRPYLRPFDPSTARVSIDWIEARTGLDFMPKDRVDALEAATPR